MDLGTKLGWATEGYSGVLDSSSLANKKKSRNKRLARFWDFLEGFKDQIDVIVYEEVRSSRHFQAMKVLCQYEGILILWALKNDIPIRGYTPSELKRRVTGHGRAKKEEMILAAEMKGHTIQKMGRKQEKSSDHADALLLLEIGKEDLI